MKNTALKTINLAWNRIGKSGIARLSAFGPKKSGPYKRKVILEDQFLENGDLPPGVEPIPADVRNTCTELQILNMQSSLRARRDCCDMMPLTHRRACGVSMQHAIHHCYHCMIMKRMRVL